MKSLFVLYWIWSLSNWTQVREGLPYWWNTNPAHILTPSFFSPDLVLSYHVGLHLSVPIYRRPWSFLLNLLHLLRPNLELIMFSIQRRSSYSIFGVVVGLQIGRPRILGSIPGSGKRFFSSAKSPGRLWDPLSPCSLGFGGSFAGAKWLKCGADHSLPSRSNVSNERSCTSTPPMPPRHA
jgi:hypothetical protein